jgi:ubiquinone/menaquinone biosynthesis C-methylase UbiE
VSDAQGNITAFWNMVAPQYEAHPGNVPAFDAPLYRAWVEDIEELMPPPPADAIDLATGTGFVALILAGLGHRVTAVDVSADMLEQASAAATSRGLSIKFLSDDAVAPALDAATFDVVTCRHLLWTLREPDRALASWRRLLRPGGRLLAFDGFWFDATGPRDDEPEPFRRYYTADTRAALPFMHIDRVEPIVAAVERAGFGDVEARSLPDLADRSDASVPYVVIGYS